MHSNIHASNQPVWPKPPVPIFKRSPADRFRDLGSEENGNGEILQKLALQSARKPGQILADLAKQMRASGWTQTSQSASAAFAGGIFTLTDKQNTFWQAILSVLHRPGHQYGRITLDVRNLTAAN